MLTQLAKEHAPVPYAIIETSYHVDTWCIYDPEDNRYYSNQKEIPQNHIIMKAIRDLQHLLTNRKGNVRVQQIHQIELTGLPEYWYHDHILKIGFAEIDELTYVGGDLMELDIQTWDFEQINPLVGPQELIYRLTAVGGSQWKQEE